MGNLITLLNNLRTLKGKNAEEPVTTAATRTQLAMLLGWGIVGGFRVIPLQLAIPPTIWQTDKTFIEKRMRSWFRYIGAGPTDERALERVI